MIEPALTAEEWQNRSVGDPYEHETGISVASSYDPGLKLEQDQGGERMDTVKVPTEQLPALIALANAALPDSAPQKITREMVSKIRCADGEGLFEIAAALESYLPPE